MNKKNVKLICRMVIYYSPDDENAFFEWLQKISSVSKYYGRLDELFLEIENSNIPEGDLEELLALFYRYQIKDMTQLKIFLNDENKEWFFDNHRAYWHERVFGMPRIKLTCNSAKFDIEEDEDLFVQLVQRIPCVDECDDFGEKLDVYVKNSTIKDEELENLLILFHRYKIDMKQLKIFLNDQNKKWFFEDKETYWHKQVFKKRKHFFDSTKNKK